MNRPRITALVPALVAVLTTVAVRTLPPAAALQSSPAARVDADTVRLTGNIHPLATAANDLGATDPALPMGPLVLMLRLGAGKQAAIDHRLAELQDPASPQFHHWLSPEQYAAEFGRTPAEIALVADWLRSQGLTVHPVPRGRGWVSFSGSVGAINRAFQVEMHDYRIGGAVRHANAQEPSIPRRLTDLVAGFVALNDLRFSRTHHVVRQARRAAAAPDCYNCGILGDSTNSLAPADLALIYDVKPLYDRGIDGTAETIAVVGSSDINMGDVTAFRSNFGLPATTPGGGPPVFSVPPSANCPDPTNLGGDDELEGDLDVEWAGAVARNATIEFVPCGTENSIDGFMLSAMYIVDNDLAPILSMSYGVCEDDLMQAGVSVSAINALWARAAMQGISVIVSSGDSGAAACDSHEADSATHGLAVSGLCSTAYNVCVGGTEFMDGSDPGKYWGTNPDPVTKATALRPIPEMAWNESADNGGVHLRATGGGISKYNSAPSWQLLLEDLGTLRAVPDVALSAAAHDGYVVFQNYSAVGCFFDFSGSPPCPQVVGGTSASTPAFAGIMALVVQAAGQRQGNPAPVLYQLAAGQESGALGQIFNDVTIGDNSVPPLTGFRCTTGYDAVTGLGSVDANALVETWPFPGATLGADPASGVAPFLTDLTATATGEGYGTVNFTYWWDCAATVTTVAEATAQCGDPTDPAIGFKADTQAEIANTHTAIYHSAGTFTPLVIVERNGGAWTATNRIVVAPPPSCTAFALSPAAAAPGPGAGSLPVAVVGSPAGCQGGAWTAAGNGTWLTVAPAAGAGSGTVTVSWTSNGGTAARTATATLGGASFQVTQGGSVAAPPPAPALLSPGSGLFPGTVTADLTAIFFWQPVAAADSYELDLSEGAILLASPVITAPASVYELAGSLADNQAYQWRMRAHGAAGWGPYSSYYYFSTYTGLATGDFALSASPSAGAVTPGAGTAFVISTTTTLGSVQTLTLSASGLPAGVSAAFSTSPVASGGQSSLTLSAAAGTAPGAYSITVTAASNLNVSHAITIGLTVNPPPQVGEAAICLTPASLGFSDQMVGTSSAVQVVTLHNCGNGPLTVTSLGASPDFFVGPGSIVPPVSLPAGTATTFSVGFSPLASGPRSGSVRIASNAPGSPTSLTLTGTATPAPLTTGTVNVVATLNGQPFSGELLFSVTGPGGTINFGNAPLSWSGQGAGSYTVAFIQEAPGGGTFTGISPSPTQTLTAGGSVLFTLAFTAPDVFGFSCPAATLTGTTALMVTAPGGSAGVDLRAAWAQGSTQTVTLAVAGLPANATASFSPQPLVIPGANNDSTFSVTTAASTPPGLYQLTFSATNQDGTTLTLTGVLVVLSAASPQLVSVGAGPAPANGFSDEPSTSADGRYVAFFSTASNLVGGDTNGDGDVFVRDLQTGTTVLASVADDGTPSAQGATWPSLSADGRYVAFSSNGDLVPGGRVNGTDVYVRDLQLGRTARASVSSAGTPADSPCLTPSISGDGRYVAFTSSASNLVAGGGGGVPQVYVRDLQLGTTAIVSVADGGAIGDAASTHPTISGNGQFVAFVSAASNFAAGATSAGAQVFLRDLRAGTTTVVSAAPDGSPANDVLTLAASSLGRLAVTPDGRFVAFASFATNLAPGDGDGNSDVFVWDRTTRQLTVASVANDGSFLAGADDPTISADGRFVAFLLFIPDAPASQIAVRDLVTQRTELLSTGPGGQLGASFSAESSLGANGRTLAFSSNAANLVAGDTNGQEDVFAVGLPSAGPVFAVSLAATPASAAGGSVAVGTLTLSAAAPAGGATVSLSSSALEVEVPPTVTVPAGASSTSFQIATLAVASELPVSLTASYGGGSPWTLLTVEPPAPARIDAVQGDGQVVAAGAALPVALAARVVDAANNPVANVAVQFSAPANGPSGVFAGGATSVLVATDASGTATAPQFIADAQTGALALIAAAPGVAAPAVFEIDVAQPGLKFFTLVPCRVVDTRGAAGALAGPALQASARRTFAIAGSCGLPSTAQAISVNVTVTGPASGGFLTLAPAGLPVPLASTINFNAGSTRANNAVLELSADGTGSFVAVNGAPGSVQFILDVNGYFQ